MIETRELLALFTADEAIHSGVDRFQVTQRLP
jgi:hypothetical protein